MRKRQWDCPNLLRSQQAITNVRWLLALCIKYQSEAKVGLIGARSSRGELWNHWFRIPSLKQSGIQRKMGTDVCVGPSTVARVNHTMNHPWLVGVVSNHPTWEGNRTVYRMCHTKTGSTSDMSA